ncbi:MAG: hypothetical protein K6E16_04080 [Lachnospiraceae bacterium]|nr:hypothetical protein [Lachnospiraceae bacterium]
MFTRMGRKWIPLLLCIAMAVPAMPAYAAEVDAVSVDAEEQFSEEIWLPEEAEQFEETGLLEEAVTAEEYSEPAEEAEPVPIIEAPEGETNLKRGSIPSSFDPRVVWPEYITPVRNQGNYGSCWAHGILFAAEVNILKNHIAPQYNNKTLNLSERVLNHIAYRQELYPDDYDPLHNSVGEYNLSSMSYDQPSYYDDGGTCFRSGAVLQRWLGVVNEIDLDPDEPDGVPNPDTYYDDIPKSGIDEIDVKYISPKGGNILAHMENEIFLDTRYRDDIKKYIIKDGALDCSYYADNDFLGSDKKSFYCYENERADHEVAMIGWDDHYDRRNFNASEDDLPKYDGAWLLRNSWDTDWGENGYFWLSYEDKSLEDITAVEMAPADNYDNNYYYAGAYSYDAGLGSDISVASVFKVKEEGGSDQQLRAVSLAQNSYDVDYEVHIYKGDYETLVENPRDGVDETNASGYWEYPGVHTIKLPDPVDLHAGEAFSVVIKLKQKYGQAVKMFVEVKTSDTVVNQHRGEAYIDIDGGGLVDVSDPEVNGDDALNFRINAYTDKIEEADAFDIKGLTATAGTPDGTEYDQTSRTVTTKFTSNTIEAGSVIDPATVLQLKYTDGIDPAKVTLTTSDEGIVKISDDGKLVATGAGRAFITAKYQGDDGDVTAREISVVVKKEIQPGWFVYEKDNKYYKPDDNEIFLRECKKFTATPAVTPGEWNWVEYEEGMGDLKRVPANAYSLNYSDNHTATDSAKAEIKTPEDGFYYAENRTITYSIDKYDSSKLGIYFNEGEWNEESDCYELDYTGQELGKIVSRVEYVDGTDVDFTFVGYYTGYDQATLAPIGDKVSPRDAGVYYALVEIDENVFTQKRIYQKFEICKQDLKNMKVGYTDRFIYTGNAIEPTVTVRSMKNTFIFRNQYEVNYQNNIGVYDLETQGITDDAPYFTITADNSGNYEGAVHIGGDSKWKNYQHPERFYFSILPADLRSADKNNITRTLITLEQEPMRAEDNDYAYTGEAVEPDIHEVKYFDDNGTTSVVLAPEDYDISYENNIYPTGENDKARVYVSGKGNYTGSVYLEFTITDDNQAAVTDTVIVSLKNAKKTSFEYTGSPIKPDVNVKLKKADGTEKPLKKTEYKLSYYNVADSADTDATNAGTWAIAITPANPATQNFKTNIATRYTIVPKDAAKIKITLNANKITQGNMTDEDYMNSLEQGVYPGVKSVKDGKNDVDDGSYQIALRNCQSCGIATAEFTFSGNYQGTKEVAYTIVGKKLSKLKFSKIKDQTVVLDANKKPMEICPEPGDDFTITDANNQPVVNNMNEATKYRIEYFNNREVGKASVLIKGCGIYEGTVVLPFKIVKRKVSGKYILAGNDNSKNDIEEVDFYGPAAVPEKIKVIDTKRLNETDDGKLEYVNIALKEGEDYTIKVTNNKKPGVGKVTVTGIGYYEGQTFRTFDLVDKRPAFNGKRDIAKLVESGKIIIYDTKLGIIDKNPAEDTVKEKLSRLYTGYPLTADSFILYDETKDDSTDGKEYMMQAGYDYVINYKNNLKASADANGNHIAGRSTPELEIKGTGPNYTGSYKITFEIKQIKLSTSSIKPLWDPTGRLAAAGYAPDIAYNGKAQKPVPCLYYLDTGYENSLFSRLLNELNPKDFALGYANNKEISNAGATLTVKPKKLDNFYVEDGQPTTLTYRFSIVEGDLADAEIAAVSEQSYKGVRVTPKPAVTLYGTKLKEGVDFVYVYSDNEGYGIGTVSIAPVSENPSYKLYGKAPSVQFVIK